MEYPWRMSSRTHLSDVIHSQLLWNGAKWHQNGCDWLVSRPDQGKKTDVLQCMVVMRNTENLLDYAFKTCIFSFLALRNTELESVVCRIYAEVEDSIFFFVPCMNP